MAKFFPHAPPADIPGSELLTWRACEQLDDAWAVFHSVVWQAMRNRRQGDGEADFVLMHPQRGIVVLEVKGGTIDVVNGKWFTTPFNSTVRKSIKDPYLQAKDSKHALIQKLGELPLRRLPTVCHGVVFPNGDISTDVALHATREITITDFDLLNMPVAIDGLLKHWQAESALSADEAGLVARLLAPTTTIRSGLRSALGTAEKALLELTDQQIQAVRGLRRSRRTLIYGGPGTGKTVLAINQARLMAEQGGSVLLTCYNEPLAGRLRSELADTPVTVSTFHSLCLTRAKAAGVAIPDPLPQTWWEHEAAAVLLEAGTGGEGYDAIVVDEGQDFSPDWITALELSLQNPTEGIVTVFADEDQAIYQAGWPPLANATEYELETNCRSTLQIVKRVTAVVQGTMIDLGTDGPPPIFNSVTDRSEGISAVQDLAVRFVDDEHLAPSSIAVLCEQRSQVDQLLGMSAGSASFVIPGKSGIATETIHRFKGLEAQVCIIWLIGEGEEQVLRSLAYVGFSRARGFLAVVAPKALKKVLNWN